MRICFFGTYTLAEGYPVNRVLVKGLRQAGAEVEECREELWGDFLHRIFSRGSPARYLRLLWRACGRYARLLWRYGRAGEHDCVVVGYAGYFDILLARLLNWRRRRPLVLVAFISLFDTVVEDRGRLPPASRRARLLKAIDRLAFCAADLVLVDTWAQAAYFAELFALPREKFHRSFVGQDDIFAPVAKVRAAVLEVLFFGTYVPLHGVEVILEAAAHLRNEGDIEFTLIGSGQLYAQIRLDAERRVLPNIRFVPEWMGSAALAERIRRADICLGIFGTTAKAARVVPYKVFGALALRKPVITRDSPAARELLADGESALLCAPGSGRALAGAIVRLRDDEALAARLAASGYARYGERGAPRAIGAALLETLEARFAR